MKGFAATKLAIDAIDRPMFALSMPNREDNDCTDTRRGRSASGIARTNGRLRDASQLHDGEMYSPAAVLNTQLDHGSWSPSHERMWSRAWRPSHPLNRCWMS